MHPRCVSRGVRQSPPFQSLRFVRITASGPLRAHQRDRGPWRRAPSARAAVLTYSNPKASLFFHPLVTLPLSLSLSFATFTLRTVEKRLVAPQAGIWKVFDVLAIRGENAERLIPKSPEDKLARFFFAREEISPARGAACVRARTNKAFIQPKVRRIDMKFFSQPSTCRLFVHLPATS